MITYRIAEDKDYDRIVDFIDMVFSMLRVPHDFEKMLPKVYSEKHRKADIHVLAENEGQLCGCLGMYTFPLRVGEYTLQIGYLGSMSVHPKARGQGIMGNLMQEQIKRGKELGLDMMILGGQRQRYQYSGFESGGANYIYSISKANVRHCLTECADSAVAFRKMEEKDLPFVCALYDKQTVSGARTNENFIDTLRSYHREAWTIVHGDAAIGYLCASSEKQYISELIVSDANSIPGIIHAWFEFTGVKSLQIQAAPYDSILNTLLAPICEGYSLSPNCMIQVLKPERVIQAYLQLKHALCPLPEGDCTLSWAGEEANLSIQVSAKGVIVSRTQKQPDIVLDHLHMHQLLFDYNPFTVQEARRNTPSHWFPLPIHIPEPDSF